MKIQFTIDHLRISGVHGSRRRVREAIERELARRVREAPPGPHGASLRLPDSAIKLSTPGGPQSAAEETGRHLAGHWQTAAHPPISNR